MRILVTGATGFVGRQLVDLLSRTSGDDVVPVSGPGTKSGMVAIDLCDDDSIRNVIMKYRPDAVYHLAGIAVTAGVDPKRYISVNALGTYSLANTVLDICGPECRFLYVSSAAVYGRNVFERQPITEDFTVRPTNGYGASKAAAENLLWPLHERGLNLRIARPFNHTGPGQQAGFVCPDIAHRLLKLIRPSSSEPTNVPLYSGSNAVRDFTDVRDVTRAYKLIMDILPSGSVVNVSSGVGYSVADVARIFAHDIEHDHQVEVRSQEDVHDSDVLIGDHSLLTERTGWRPTIPLVESLRDLWASILRDIV